MRSEAEEDDKYSAWFFDLAGKEQNRFSALVKGTISQKFYINLVLLYDCLSDVNIYLWSRYFVKVNYIIE
jgi:hypothetical protein